MVTINLYLLPIIKEDAERNRRFNVLVHCSAGVGRTGCFIALYKMMEQIESILERRRTMPGNNQAADENQKINIFTTVFELRSKRVEMVQSWVQYKYLYASVSEYARQIANDSQANDEDYVMDVNASRHNSQSDDAVGYVNASRYNSKSNAGSGDVS